MPGSAHAYKNFFFQSNSYSWWIAPSVLWWHSKNFSCCTFWGRSLSSHRHTKSPLGEGVHSWKGPESCQVSWQLQSFLLEQSIGNEKPSHCFRGHRKHSTAAGALRCSFQTFIFSFHVLHRLLNSSRFISLCHINLIAVISLGSESLNYTLNPLSMISLYCYSISH